MKSSDGQEKSTFSDEQIMVCIADMTTDYRKRPRVAPQKLDQKYNVCVKMSKSLKHVWFCLDEGGSEEYISLVGK